MRTPRKNDIRIEGHRIFDLRDSKDVLSLNNLTNAAGIYFEHNLSEVYVRIDMDRYRVFAERKAGRRSVITNQLQQRVYALRYNKVSLREIARETNISTATVWKILKDYKLEKDTGQLKLDL